MAIIVTGVDPFCHALELELRDMKIVTGVASFKDWREPAHKLRSPQASFASGCLEYMFYRVKGTTAGV